MPANVRVHRVGIVIDGGMYIHFTENGEDRSK